MLTYQVAAGLKKRASHGRRRMKGASEYFILNQEEAIDVRGLECRLRRRSEMARIADGLSEQLQNFWESSGRHVVLMTIALSFAGWGHRAEGDQNR